MERDVIENGGLDRDKISTHTLTWSVTFDEDEDEEVEEISTHTLTWSVTIFIFSYPVITKFQLTRSRGA